MSNTSPLQEGDIAILGMPFDKNSSFLRGAAKAPEAIRAAFHSASSNSCTEDGTDLSTSGGWFDLGNVAAAETELGFDDIEDAVRAIRKRGVRPLILGGDHSITYPIIKAFNDGSHDLTILQLDAHPDLYDELDGNRYSHGCPFARIMEDGLAKRLIQVGIRTMTPHQSQQAERFNVEVFTAAEWKEYSACDLSGPLYLTLDMDVLDPAFAPGVSHHEPGGLSTRDVLEIVQSIQGQLVGADIVELNPDRDPQGITSMVAAKFLKEVIALMLGQRKRDS